MIQTPVITNDRPDIVKKTNKAFKAMAMVAHIFAGLRITPFFCQSAIGGPNRG
jgi:hypothetical protein